MLWSYDVTKERGGWALGTTLEVNPLSVWVALTTLGGHVVHSWNANWGKIKNGRAVVKFHMGADHFCECLWPLFSFFGGGMKGSLSSTFGQHHRRWDW